MIRRIDASRWTWCNSTGWGETQLVDMTDNYDLAIFGSNAASRLLALSLAQNGGMKVLHISDSEQIHHLPTSPQLSAGYCTSPDFFEAAAEGAETIQRLLSPYKDVELVSARPNAIFARLPQHGQLIEFTEGAAIHANIVCERRVHSATHSEQLIFPEAVSFDEHNIRQFVGPSPIDIKGLSFLQRHEFERSHITKDGRFSGKSNTSTYKADRVLLMDHDLIEFELETQTKRIPLQSFPHQVLRFHQQKNFAYAAQQDISTGLWQYGFAEADILFSSVGSVDQLATYLFKHFPDIADRRIRQMDQKRFVTTTDGYPLFDVIGDRNVMCFCGAQHFEVALMPLLAESLSNEMNTDSPLWRSARVQNRQAGAGTLLQMAVAS
ncbi:hypothetical protein ATL17_1814 [Maritalea mobilis]|uniref:Glycine/D-amino acid oxidase-like deaminating enzyme n=1 Tax=Maritalea mobilis TaxID=483324 RepID=A0A4R6VNM3_9HYPH|nr:hypothetical protein [Maritalea mobilis]TDQ63806.1 hypothetical protein ATL17_1814 [Maritalea mobilis]